MVDLGTVGRVFELAAGNDATCAVLDYGQFKCWGFNMLGGLGLGDTANRGDGPGEMGDNLPAVSLGQGYSSGALSLGCLDTCTRLAGGGVKCWGFNGQGRLGLGDQRSRGDGPGEMGDNLPFVDL